MQRQRKRAWSRWPLLTSSLISVFHQKMGEGHKCSNTKRASLGALIARYEATMPVPNVVVDDDAAEDEEIGEERRPWVRICWWICRAAGKDLHSFNKEANEDKAKSGEGSEGGVAVEKRRVLLLGVAFSSKLRSITMKASHSAIMTTQTVGITSLRNAKGSKLIR